MSEMHAERCTSEPISWLRLEQRAISELGPSEVADIDAHVAGCSVCSSCADMVATDIALEPMAALPRPPSAQPPWFRRPWFAVATVGAIAAAALLLFTRTNPKGTTSALELQSYPPARVRIKGGELAIDLVRQHDGSVATNPRIFSPGDRFKVLATCPASVDVDRLIEVTVIQNRESATPIEPFRTACGNRLALPGAFSLSGHASATVCIELSSDRACATIQPSDQ